MPEVAFKSALRVRQLRKVYKDVVAVDGLDLEVQTGECFGLLGPNGAGKTTTVEICEGLTVPDSGEVEVLAGTGVPMRTNSDSASASNCRTRNFPKNSLCTKRCACSAAFSGKDRRPRKSLRACSWRKSKMPASAIYPAAKGSG